MTLEEYLKKNPKTHLIFDFDETIAELILPWNRWEEDIKDELVKIDKSIYTKYKNRQINLSILENSYISKYPQTKKLIIKNSINFENKYLKDVVPNKNLIDFIKGAKNYQMFIWSSNTRQAIKTALQKFAILNKFNKLVTRNDLNLLKPDPEGFRKIYDPKIPKENYLFIADRSIDRDAAEKSGIDFYLEDYFERKNTRDLSRG